MSRSKRFSEKYLKHIRICTQIISSLLTSNIKKCSQITEELKVVTKEYKELRNSFAYVSLKYGCHMRSAPSTVYYRRCEGRGKVLTDCASEYDYINEKLVETCKCIRQIQTSVEVIAKDQMKIKRLQNRVLRLSSRLGIDVTQLKNVCDVNTS